MRDSLPLTNIQAASPGPVVISYLGADPAGDEVVRTMVVVAGDGSGCWIEEERGRMVAGAAPRTRALAGVAAVGLLGVAGVVMVVAVRGTEPIRYVPATAVAAGGCAWLALVAAGAVGRRWRSKSPRR